MEERELCREVHLENIQNIIPYLSRKNGRVEGIFGTGIALPTGFVTLPNPLLTLGLFLFYTGTRIGALWGRGWASGRVCALPLALLACLANRTYSLIDAFRSD